MSKIYYCYSCGEYFKVRSADLKLNQDTVLCPHCEGDDTEYSPEEEIDNRSDDYSEYAYESDDAAPVPFSYNIDTF